MTFARIIALSTVSVLCLAVLLAGAPAAASQADSTPAEQAQTRQLNQNITKANAATDAQSVEKNAVYQGEQNRYQEQLAVYRASQENYEERAAHYQAARDRYIAAHARYHRAVWPARYEQRLIVDTRDLLGAHVHTANGRTVGHVVEISLQSDHVDALRVALDHSRGDVWIESADLRFDADKKMVMTNLNRRNLYEMTHESY